MKAKSKRNAISAKAARMLRRVGRHILAEPRRYDQNIWLQQIGASVVELYPKVYPPCGTMGCIAGWTEVLYRKGRSKKTADALLGLKFEHTESLFGRSSDWPEPYQSAYDKASSQLRRAKVAVRRIEHFIRTGN